MKCPKCEAEIPDPRGWKITGDLESCGCVVVFGLLAILGYFGSLLVEIAKALGGVR